MVGTTLYRNKDTRGEVSLELPFPYTPYDQPSHGQIMKRTPTNKIITGSVTGGNFLNQATLIRTYWLNKEERDALLDFLNTTCQEWTLPFTLDDPVETDIIDRGQVVYADRRAFGGFRPYSNTILQCTITFRISIS